MQKVNGLNSINFDKSCQYYSQLAMIFITLLLTTNVVGEKPIDFGWIVVPAGLLLFPGTYLLGDVLTEVYGFSQARRVVWMGMFCNLFMGIVCRCMAVLPASSTWPHHEAYTSVLTSSSRLMAISSLSYFSGEWINAYIVSKLKEKMKGRFFWMRALCGSWVGEAVDSAIFIPLAFYPVMSKDELLSFMLFCYSFKVAYSFVTIPIASQLVAVLKAKARC